jgi:predicted phosphodiesterase
MKYAIFSDVHSNFEALTAFFRKCDELGVDQQICLGDIVGYGADPNFCIDAMRIRNIPCVKGNHDELVSRLKMGMLLDVNDNAASAATWQHRFLNEDDKKWLEDLPMVGSTEHFDYTHANFFSNRSWGYVINHEQGKHCVQNLTKDIGFIGHTHRPCAMTDEVVIFDNSFKIQDGKKYLINVGSVGQPRDHDQRICFVTYDTDTKEVYFHRAAYEIQKAVHKILTNENLNDYLGNRLLQGI